MKLAKVLCWIVLVCLCYGHEFAAAQTASEPLRNGERILVLKNGNVLFGFVTREPERFFVQTSQGSRLIVTSDQADFVCDSFDEAYWGRLSRIKASDTNEQIKLFHWCLRYQLFEHAENQLQVLASVTTDYQRFDYLRRQFTGAVKHQARLESQPKPSVSALANDRERSRRADDPSESGLMTLNSDDWFLEVDPIFEPLPSVAIENSKLPARQETSPVFATIRSPAERQAEIVQVSYEESIESLMDDANRQTSAQEGNRLRPLPATIGAIPQLDSHRQKFTPRDEFDPEIFNRHFIDGLPSGSAE